MSVGHVTAIQLLDGATTIGAGNTYRGPAERTFHAIGSTSAGAGSATIDVEVSDDGSNWVTAGTITLTLATTASSDGLYSPAPWAFVRGNVTAISGTGASVDLFMGY